MGANDQIKAWLRKAYTMEQSVEDVLESYVRDAGEYPEIERKFQEHLAQTREHARRVKDCLRSQGEEAPSGRTLLGSLTGIAKGLTSESSNESLLRDLLSGYGASHFQIACYKSLIAAAREAELPEVQAACEKNLADEIEMAEWLERQIPQVTVEQVRAR